MVCFLIEEVMSDMNIVACRPVTKQRIGKHTTMGDCWKRCSLFCPCKVVIEFIREELNIETPSCQDMSLGTAGDRIERVGIRR
jgi:hypothetical protein